MDFRDILFVSDYDNTMTGEDHLVPQKNLDAIHEFTSAGGAFTLGSGRGKREWYDSFHEVPFNAPLILSNGATIYDAISDKILYHAFLTEEQKKQAEKLFLSLPEGCSGLIESEEKVYIPLETYEITGFKGFPGSNPSFLPIREIPGKWDKVSFIAVPQNPPSSADNPYAFLSADTSGMDLLENQAKNLGVSGIRSLPMMYEIPPAGTDKGTSALHFSFPSCEPARFSSFSIIFVDSSIFNAFSFISFPSKPVQLPDRIQFTKPVLP